MALRRMAAKIGIGTYRTHPDLESLLLQSLELGIRVIDTAPNYQNGKAHAIIGRALHMALARRVPRSTAEIFVSTKVGYARNSQSLHRMVVAGQLSCDHIVGNHCLSPVFIRKQIDRSVRDLRRTPLDMVFVHNPEHQLPRVGRAGLASLVRQTFVELENAVAVGVLRRYGVSSWTGLSSAKAAPPLSVSKLMQLATEIAGSRNHFKAIQLPVSLIRIEAAASFVLRGEGPIGEATSLGLSVFGSSPLHGGELPPLVDPELAAIIGPGEMSVAQACLLFARSITGIECVLTSPTSSDQLRETIAVGKLPTLESREIYRLINLIYDTR